MVAVQLTLSSVSQDSLLALTDASVSLIRRILDMTSRKSTEHLYSAASFEEVFVIIQSGVESGDSDLCKKAGEALWRSISALLQLLDSLSKALLDLAMKSYLSGEDSENLVERISLVGDSCIQCIFR